GDALGVGGRGHVGYRLQLEQVATRAAVDPVGVDVGYSSSICPGCSNSRTRRPTIACAALWAERGYRGSARVPDRLPAKREIPGRDPVRFSPDLPVLEGHRR